VDSRRRKKAPALGVWLEAGALQRSEEGRIMPRQHKAGNRPDVPRPDVPTTSQARTAKMPGHFARNSLSARQFTTHRPATLRALTPHENAARVCSLKSEKGTGIESLGGRVEHPTGTMIQRGLPIFEATVDGVGLIRSLVDWRPVYV